MSAIHLVSIGVLAVLAWGIWGAIARPATDTDPRKPDYHLVVPDEYSATAVYPLVISLHGLGDNGQNFDRSMAKLSQQAKQGRFILARPDGLQNSRGQRFWHASDACCNFEGQQIDHVAYIQTMIQQIAEQHPIDKNHIAAIGFSNGAFMAYRLACEPTVPLSHIVAIAGFEPTSTALCKQRQPAHILHIHGDKDNIVPYTKATNRRGKATIGVANQIQRWIDFMACSPDPLPAANLDLHRTLKGFETVVKKWHNCRSNGSVSLWTVHGAEHGLAPTAELNTLLVDFLMRKPPLKTQ